MKLLVYLVFVGAMIAFVTYMLFLTCNIPVVGEKFANVSVTLFMANLLFSMFLPDPIRGIAAKEVEHEMTPESHPESHPESYPAHVEAEATR